MKHNLHRIVVIITAILFSCTLYNNFSININAEAIPAVLEQNYSRMDKINEYGGEFVVDYVSESWDYETVERILNDVQALSDEICSGYSDDYDKICAIADYVSNTISYDLDAKHNAVTFDVISLENVLEKKRTTCAGFANLFSCMCNAQGFYCVNIRGSAISGEDGIYRDNLDDENTVMNHEWTAVDYNGRWVFVDCTWDCTNYYSNGEFQYGSGAVTKYLDISLEDLSVSHKATIVDHRNFFDALSVLEKPETETHEETQTEYVENKSAEQEYEETSEAYQPEEETESEISSLTSVSESITESSSEITSLSFTETETETTTVSYTQTEETSDSVSESYTETFEIMEDNSDKRGNANILIAVVTGLAVIITAVVIGIGLKK